MVVSKEMDRVVGGGMVYVVVAMHSSGASVMVVSTGSPGAGGLPNVMVEQNRSKHAGLGGQPRFDVARGVVRHAGLSPGMVMVVGRRSTILVHPSSGKVEGPVQVIGGAQGGAIQTVEV